MTVERQDLCLVGSEGWKHMDIFDDLPDELRVRLADARINICTACFLEEWHKGPCTIVSGTLIIAEFEQMVLSGRTGELARQFRGGMVVGDRRVYYD